jgi:hypothetical protein
MKKGAHKFRSAFDGAQAVNKLDSMVGLSGLRTRGILINYRSLRAGSFLLF